MRREHEKAYVAEGEEKSCAVNLIQIYQGARLLNLDRRLCHDQAFKLKFGLREFTSCLCSAAALAVCSKGRVADLDATETWNKLSQPKFEFTSLALLSMTPWQKLCWIGPISETFCLLHLFSQWMLCMQRGKTLQGTTQLKNYFKTTSDFLYWNRSKHG